MHCACRLHSSKGAPRDDLKRRGPGRGRAGRFAKGARMQLLNTMIHAAARASQALKLAAAILFHFGSHFYSSVAIPPPPSPHRRMRDAGLLSRHDAPAAPPRATRPTLATPQSRGWSCKASPQTACCFRRRRSPQNNPRALRPPLPLPPPLLHYHQRRTAQRQ